MKAEELRKKDIPELESELYTLLREQFNLRMQHGMKQLTRTHQLRNVRRSIGRVKTILTEKSGANK